MGEGRKDENTISRESSRDCSHESVFQTNTWLSVSPIDATSPSSVNWTFIGADEICEFHIWSRRWKLYQETLWSCRSKLLLLMESLCTVSNNHHGFTWLLWLTTAPLTCCTGRQQWFKLTICDLSLLRNLYRSPPETASSHSPSLEEGHVWT